MAVIGSGLPIPEIYGQKQNSAQRAFEEALAELAAQERQTSLDFGYRQGQSGYELDPNLQFGLAQQMLRGHSGALTGARASMSGRGLGKAGLSRQRERLLRFLQQGDLASLSGRFTRGMQGIQSGRSSARRGRDDAFNMAEAEALQYAIQNGLFNTATPPAAASGGAGVGGVTDFSPSRPDQNTLPGGQTALLETMTQAYDPAMFQDTPLTRRRSGGAGREWQMV